MMLPRNKLNFDLKVVNLAKNETSAMKQRHIERVHTLQAEQNSSDDNTSQQQRCSRHQTNALSETIHNSDLKMPYVHHRQQTMIDSHRQVQAKTTLGQKFSPTQTFTSRFSPSEMLEHVNFDFIKNSKAETMITNGFKTTIRPIYSDQLSSFSRFSKVREPVTPSSKNPKLLQLSNKLQVET